MKRTATGNNLVLCFATAALAIGSAASYNITLFQPSTINGKELKEGNYKLELNDRTAVIRQGKTAVEAEIKTETVDKKYGSTSVKYVVTNGKNNIQEIRLGGTKTNWSLNPRELPTAAFRRARNIPADVWNRRSSVKCPLPISRTARCA